eukprot:1762239-Pleurochrysis_carterae.AAC.1
MSKAQAKRLVRAQPLRARSRLHDQPRADAAELHVLGAQPLLPQRQEANNHHDDHDAVTERRCEHDC